MGDEPFWRVGYGYVDLTAAVALVRSEEWPAELDAAQSAASARALATDGYQVERSDFWTYNAPRATAGTDQHAFTAPVDEGITHVKVVIAHPSLAVIGQNRTHYTVTVKDAAGRVVGTTTEAPVNAGSGTASVLIDLAAAGASFGEFTFEVTGDYAASDPDTVDSDSLLGRMVTMQVAQLIAD